MTLLDRVIVLDDSTTSIAGMKLFSFDLTGGAGDPSFYGISLDFHKLFKYVQVGGTDGKKNSWFFNDQVISDGRLFGLVPVLKGWFFLALFAQCGRARDLFMSVDDMLFEAEAVTTTINPIISEMLAVNRVEIEEFLAKLMPSQKIIEDSLGFRYDEAAVANSLHEIILQKSANLNALDSESSTEYFEAKWSSTCNVAVVLDNLQLHLPAGLFDKLCDRFKMHPISTDDLNKRLKITESLLLKPIKHQTGRDADCLLAPTADYTKFDAKLKPEKAKNPKFAVTGNTSMLNFFKKAA